MKLIAFLWASKLDVYFTEYFVYFTEYFLAVEIDKQNHESRELIFEKKRQQALEKKLGCKFIRINTSDAERG